MKPIIINAQRWTTEEYHKAMALFIATPLYIWHKYEEILTLLRYSEFSLIQIFSLDRNHTQLILRCGHLLERKSDTTFQYRILQPETKNCLKRLLTQKTNKRLLVPSHMTACESVLLFENTLAQLRQEGVQQC